MNYLWILLLTPALALAHGEDKPGPHGGAIRMPGAFHTEAIVSDTGDLYVYFLDVNFQQLSPKLFKLGAALGSETASCTTKAERSECKFPSPLMGKTGKLVLKLQKGKGPKSEAVYELPLNGKHH
ncbi:MAG: hypothetical protein HUU37_08705 [Bdellovibrionales bacterium]|nr:hypothetical protein [Bdellovibrionales bacterium]